MGFWQFDYKVYADYIPWCLRCLCGTTRLVVVWNTWIIEMRLNDDDGEWKKTIMLRVGHLLVTMTKASQNVEYNVRNDDEAFGNVEGVYYNC
jgi:hypothetical protein